MKVYKSKIEFFVSEADKKEFKRLCKEKSYNMAELMRRAFEEKLKWIKQK